MNNKEIRHQGAGSTCQETENRNGQAGIPEELVGKWKAEIGPSDGRQNHLEIKLLWRIDRKISAMQKDVGELCRAPRPVRVQPEPHDPPDNAAVAQGVFDIIRRIELPARDRKAPLVKVFQLYCLDGLTSFEVAKKCRCSRSLVMLRLSQLAKKTGCSPSQLSALAGNAPG